MMESTLLSSTLSRNPAQQQVSNQVLCEGDEWCLISGLDYWTDHFFHLRAPYPAICVRSCKVEVMCRKLGRAILFWLADVQIRSNHPVLVRTLTEIVTVSRNPARTHSCPVL